MNEKVSQLLTPAVFAQPQYLGLSAWTEHVPFAFWLMEAHKPQIFVELGTHYGTSYFAFCQGRVQSQIGTRCYAVDTWKGDEHASFYGEDCFTCVSEYNQKLYSSFSTLLRSTFDDALPYFDDGSIDILHLDGYHTKEVIDHDIAMWLPKMSSKGLLILHDTNVRERNFGVFLCLEELKKQYEIHEFYFGHGLAVVQIGSDQPSRIRDLFDLNNDPESKLQFHEILSRLGKGYLNAFDATEKSQTITKTNTQLANFQKQLADVSCELSNLKIEQTNTKAEFQSAQLELHELQNVSCELSNLKIEQTNTKAEFQSAQLELHELQSNLIESERQHTLHNEKLQLAEKYNEEYRTTNHHLQTQLLQFQKYFDSVFSELQSETKKSKSYFIEKTTAQTNMLQLEEQLKKLKTDITTIQYDQEVSQKSIADYKNLLSKKNNNLESITHESNKIQNELVHTQIFLQNVKTQCVTLQESQSATQSHVNALLNSISWRITAPLRCVYDILLCIFRIIIKFSIHKTLFTLRYSWTGNAIYKYCFPQSLKDRINRAWRSNISQNLVPQPSHLKEVSLCHVLPASSAEAPILTSVASPKQFASKEPVFTPNPAWYEEKQPLPGLADAVKVIAFYLPQFHPIPENDNWWGEGFTEWKNVIRAKPMFDGHYQPRLPGAMGFYDLRLPDVLRKQAALAKEFGVHGFCFHHYYFAGKRLLETPVNNLLANTDIDLPFCLCWANENWTRRWDGLEQDVLIAQEHSSEDDINFLKDIQKYFDDPRYIRVGGKPLLIIYKATQFPDMAATIKRWRAHADKNGQDLYLVMAQTFDEKDPRGYGFDAAVEFPPHSGIARSPLPSPCGTHKDFCGGIYDYDYPPSIPTDYTLFKTISPGWDNTQRKMYNADIFANPTPEKYCKALKDALKFSKQNNVGYVFINAWNEWAESAYLEPDAVYGYAYLNATSRALYLSNYNFFDSGKILFCNQHAKKIITNNVPSIAIHIHLFYTDVLDEIINYLKNMPFAFDLYVSIANDDFDSIKLAFQINLSQCKHIEVCAFPNMGQDVAPFYVGFAESLSKYDIISHIHTKKSPHMGNAGEEWRTYLFKRLFPNTDTLQNMLVYFYHNSAIKLLYPKTFKIIDSFSFWGSNFSMAAQYAEKMNIKLIHTNEKIDFPAGNMFWIKKSHYQKLCKLNLAFDDFLKNHTIKDGTLAHALERLVGATLKPHEYRSIELTYDKTEKGKCPVCESEVLFSCDHDWLRDHYKCSKCGSLPRDRALHYNLNNIGVELKHCTCLGFAPVNDHLANKVKEYTKSQYFFGHKQGTIIDNALNLDMEKCVLDDNSFDLVVHEDIFEHLFEPELAFRECVRIVKPGGYILFTVPIHHTVPTSVQRAQRALDDSVSYLLPATYHGNPVGDGSSLVVWDYGHDFEQLLTTWSKGLPIRWLIRSTPQPEYGIEGEHLDVVIVQKI